MCTSAASVLLQALKAVRGGEGGGASGGAYSLQVTNQQEQEKNVKKQNVDMLYLRLSGMGIVHHLA